MTFDTVILGQQRVIRVSKDVKWTLGSSPRVTGERKILRMTFILWILISSTSMVDTVRAECTPTPDCAEMGYTETSCSGDSLKCPFDLTKLYCIPCDTSFQYACNDTGQVGKGVSCDGKYQECGCDSSYKYSCTGARYPL